MLRSEVRRLAAGNRLPLSGGGAIVSAFSILGGIFRQRSFAGLRGEARAARAAALDARGTAMGTVGLMAFAITAWQLLPAHRTALVPLGATVVWFSVAAAIGRLRKAIGTSQWARNRRKAKQGRADAA
jgi:hypothetical protein